MAKGKHEKRENESPVFWEMLQRSARGAAIALLGALLLSLPCALLSASLSDPSAAARIMGLGLSLLCYLSAGMLSAHQREGSFLIYGILSGLLLSLFLCLLGFLTGASLLHPTGWLLKLLGIGFSSAGAYLMGVRRPSRRRPGRHSHGR